MEPTPIIPNPNSLVEVHLVPLTGRFVVQVNKVAVDVDGKHLFDSREEAEAAADKVRQSQGE